MIVTIRELSAFVNVLERLGRKALAKDLRKEVLRMVDSNLAEVNIEDTTTDGKRLCILVKDARKCLKYLKNQKGAARK